MSDHKATRVQELEDELNQLKTRWQEDCRHIIALTDTLNQVGTCTILQWIEQISLVRHGVRVKAEHVESALNFMAAAGLLSPGQYEVFGDFKREWIMAVLSTPQLSILAEKAAKVHQGETLVTSEQDYATLGTVSMFAVAHAELAAKDDEADQWRKAYETLRRSAR